MAKARADIVQLLHDYGEITDLNTATGDYEAHGVLWSGPSTKEGVFHVGRPSTPMKLRALSQKEYAENWKVTWNSVTNINGVFPADLK